MSKLHLGLELEFGTVSLVSYRSATKLKSYLGKPPSESTNTRNVRRSYELRDITYGMRVARSKGRVKVDGHQFLRTEIEVEGADKGKHKIPELKSAPMPVAHLAPKQNAKEPDRFLKRVDLKTGQTHALGRASSEMEAQNLAITLFKEALEQSVRDLPDFHFEINSAQNVQYYKLKRVLERYNQLIDWRAPLTLKALMQEFKLEEVRDGSWGWAVGKLSSNKNSWTDATVQVNFEVPFRKIGTAGGLPKENFTPGGWVAYDSSRDQAEKMVTWLCARNPKLDARFDRSRLHSLFTLYFFGLCAHWTNDRRAIVMKKESDEQRATANKSNWEVLPKVRWQDLWKEALSAPDRALIPMDGEGWKALKTQMNERLKAVGEAITRANDALAPFRDGPERQWNFGWMEIYHETLFHQRTFKTMGVDPKTGQPVEVEHKPHAYSSTGKPLPVGQGSLNGVSEPLIVFEVRRSGFNQEMSAVINKSKPLGPLVEKVITAQTI
ncbi:MAG: hypothetical protein U1F56_00770 [Rubrivivax sp.]